MRPSKCRGCYSNNLKFKQTILTQMLPKSLLWLCLSGLAAASRRNSPAASSEDSFDLLEQEIGNVGPNVDEAFGWPNASFHVNATQATPVSLKPWSIPRVGQLTRFNISLYDPMAWSMSKVEPLKWSQLRITHLRKMHILIVSEDLTIFGHVHPEDYEHWNGDGLLTTPKDLCEFVIEFKFPRSGRYAIVVEYQAIRSESPSDGSPSDDHHAHEHTDKPDDKPLESDADEQSQQDKEDEEEEMEEIEMEGDRRRHSHSDATTVDISTIVYLDVEHVEGAPKPRPIPNITHSEGMVAFHGIHLTPPFVHTYTDAIVPSDLAKEKPKYTKNATEEVYIMRIGNSLENERVVGNISAKVGSCTPLFIEFSELKDRREVPMTDLTPLLEATSHVSLVHESLEFAEHVHTESLSTVDVSTLCPVKHSHQGFPPLTFGPVLVAAVEWKRAGVYRLIAQSARSWGKSRVMLAGSVLVYVEPDESSQTGSGLVEGGPTRIGEGNRAGLAWVGWMLISGSLLGLLFLWKSPRGAAVNVPKSRLRGNAYAKVQDESEMDDLEQQRLNRDVVFQLEDED
jgi:hypothetical protein